jgi:hypothetical protein
MTVLLLGIKEVHHERVARDWSAFGAILTRKPWPTGLLKGADDPERTLGALA